MSGFWTQVGAVAALTLRREYRRGDVLWVTIPFGALALLLFPLGIGTDVPLLRRLGPGLFWVVVLLFGVLVTVRPTGAPDPAQRDTMALLGLDPAAGYVGRSAAAAVLLLGFEFVVGTVAFLVYDVPPDGWGWVLVVALLVAVGLALLGTMAAAIAASRAAGTVLVPLLVAPLAVPVLLGAVSVHEGLSIGATIVSWIILMIAVDLVLAIAGVLSARPLQETR